MRPDVFQIQLEKTVFFPGETIRGNLRIRNQLELRCKGIRISLQGKGHSYFTTGSGDDERSHSHSQVYASCKKTVWGNVMKTPVLHDAGANAIFGPPWAPDEGVFYFSVSNEQKYIVVRVMDYNWLTKDDLLGEVLIDIPTYVNSGDVVNLQLQRNGLPESGFLEFSLQWETVNTIADVDNPKNQTIRLQIHSATGLRPADWLGGRNKVYIQAYALADDDHPLIRRAFPIPNESLKLASCDMQLPFHFELPEDLPSSFVHDTRNFIAYSLYANIEIGWMQDVSHRIFFTVMQPSASAAMMYPLYKYLEEDIYAQGCIPPCCCCNIPLVFLGSYGTMKINSYLERSAYAPGEVMPLVVRVETRWTDESKPIQFTGSAQLMRHVTLFAGGNTKEYIVEVTQKKEIRNFNDVTYCTVPSIAPTYLGGLGQDLDWYGRVSRYGGRWANKYPDPIVWRYSLEVAVCPNVPGCAICPLKLSIGLPVVVSGIGLSILPTIHSSDGVVMKYSSLLDQPTVAQAIPVQYSESSSSSSANVQQTPLHQPIYNSEMDFGYRRMSDGNVAETYVNQAIVFPSQQSSDDQVIPDWKKIPEIKDSMSSMSSCPVVPYAGQAVMIRDNQEDYDVDQSQLIYQPVYYTNPPNFKK